MVSAAEQLVSNLNFAAFAKAGELKKRIWFTLGALLIYRLGTYIPIPGINPQALAEMFRQNQTGILGMFNMFSGGAVGRMAIFALNIMPYISASIIIQLLTTVSPHLEQLKKEGEQGRRQINQYTGYGPVLLATLQGYVIAIGLEGAGNVVLDPGWFFRITTAITLVGGTVFLMWLGEQITAGGGGERISLLIFCRRRAHLHHHLRRHRGAIASCGGRHPRARPPRRTVDHAHHPASRHVRGRGGRDSVHGTRPAAIARAISETPGRQPHVSGRRLAFAAEAEQRRRDPADLRLIASALADHGR